MYFLAAEQKLLIPGFTNLIVLLYTRSCARLCVSVLNLVFLSTLLNTVSQVNFPSDIRLFLISVLCVFKPGVSHRCVREITKLFWTPDIYNLYWRLFKKKKFAYDAEHVHVCNYVRLKSCLLEKSVTAVQISLIGLGVELISMLNR